MALYKLKVFRATPKKRTGLSRLPRQPARRGTPDGDARARALDRLRHGPRVDSQRGHIDWAGVTIVGAVLLGLLVLGLLVVAAITV